MRFCDMFTWCAQILWNDLAEFCLQRNCYFQESIHLIYCKVLLLIQSTLQFLFYTFVQVYRNSVLIETPSLPITPGRYVVIGLDPETSYRFAATVSNAIGRSRQPLYTSAVTTLGMSMCGTRSMCWSQHIRMSGTVLKDIWLWISTGAN